MNMNGNFNENMHILLHNRKMMLLIPGAILVAIAVSLLITVSVASNLEPIDHHPALNEHTETITTEIIHTKEYLSQLSDVVNDVSDNWHTVANDNYISTSSMNNIIEDKIGNLTTNLDLLKIRINSSGDDLTKLIIRLENLRTMDNEAVINELVSIYNDFSSQVSNSLAEIHDYYTSTNNLAKHLIAELNKSNDADNEKLLEVLRTMSEKIESESSESLTQMMESINHVALQLNNNTEYLINRLLSFGFEISELAEMNQDQLIYLLNQINVNSSEQANENKLELIRNLAGLGFDLEMLANKNHDELKLILVQMGFDTSKLLNESRDEILMIIDELGSDNAYLMGKFSNMESRLYLDFANINSNINDKNANATDRFNLFDTRLTTIDTRLDALFLSVSNGKTALATSLLTDSAVTERVSILSGLGITSNNAQNVSFAHYAKAIADSTNVTGDGKKLLASAIRAKNVTISDTATFAEMAMAIQNIQHSITIENVVGTLSYVHHFHTITGATGTDITNAIQDGHMQEAPGGCFTAPVYHVHTGQSGADGGCYTENQTHVHTGSASSGGGCYGTFHPAVPGSGWQCSSRNSGSIREHMANNNQCGSYGHLTQADYNAGIMNLGEYHVGGCSQIFIHGTSAYYSLSCGHPTTPPPQFGLGCGMTTSSIVARSLSCGRLRNQVVSASIIF